MSRGRELLVWIDVETTGFDPGSDALLEVAAVVTDGNLQEIERAEWVTNAAAEVPFAAMHPGAAALHVRSGLWLESCLSRISVHRMHHELAELIGRHHIRAPFPDTNSSAELRAHDAAEDANRPQLAGSSVHFDREFIRRHAPLAFQKLHYRNLDVSAFLESSRRFWPEVYAARPHAKRPQELRPHRAMADILESIELLAYFRQNLAGVVS